MPAKQSRTTRTTRATRAAAAEAEAAQEEAVSHEEPTQRQVDGMNDENGKVEPQATTTAAGTVPNGTQMDDKLPAPKSAAQKKREKRKQKRREGSVMSEVSDAESVMTPGCRSLLTPDNLHSHPSRRNRDDPRKIPFNSRFNRYGSRH